MPVIRQNGSPGRLSSNQTRFNTSYGLIYNNRTGAE